jgi:microcystin-dependent protein
MSEPFISEIRIFSFPFAPQGWAACNGQILNIAQNSALYALIGILYGGDGKTTFALPNLQGRAPFHMSAAFPEGKSAGEAVHALALTEMPVHTHVLTASMDAANAPAPTNNYWATSASDPYATTRNADMSPAALASAGSSQPHENMSPYLALNFCIALMGLFPSRG